MTPISEFKHEETTGLPPHHDSELTKQQQARGEGVVQGDGDPGDEQPTKPVVDDPANEHQTEVVPTTQPTAPPVEPPPPTETAAPAAQ